MTMVEGKERATDLSESSFVAGLLLEPTTSLLLTLTQSMSHTISDP